MTPYFHNHYDADLDRRWPCYVRDCHGSAPQPPVESPVRVPTPLALADILAAAVLAGEQSLPELQTMAQLYVRVRGTT
jgi:hypothetical protein